MNELTEEILFFKNKLIEVFNVQLKNLPEVYPNTGFKQKRLLVEY